MEAFPQGKSVEVSPRAFPTHPPSRPGTDRTGEQEDLNCTISDNPRSLVAPYASPGAHGSSDTVLGPTCSHLTACFFPTIEAKWKHNTSLSGSRTESKGHAAPGGCLQ